jgi:hypothetical protein
MTDINDIVMLEGASLAGNIIKNVHVCGLVSQNGRVYLSEGLKTAVPLYENVDVYLNHGEGERKVEDKLGWLTGAHFREGSGVWANEFHLNPMHEAFSKIKWWAEHNPAKLGFSHVIAGKSNPEQTIVSEIAKVKSVDLVAQPATVAGLHESVNVEGDAKIRLDKLITLSYDVATSAVWNSKLSEAERNDKLRVIFEEALKELTPLKETKMALEWKDVTLEELQKNRPELVTAIGESAQAREKLIQESLAKVPEKARTKLFEAQVREACSDKAKLDELVADRVEIANLVESVKKPAPIVPDEKPTKTDAEIAAEARAKYLA